MYVFSSESVSEGHPDKVADQISDAILDACLAADPESHVACETACGKDLVANLGEITCNGFKSIDTEAIARSVVRDIGYDRDGEGFSCDSFKYVSNLIGQSPDIAMGVNRGSDEEQGAGDQGMMFGYATQETDELMPATLVWSHKILRNFAKLRKDGSIPYLRPDSKAQISALYDGARLVRFNDIVVSHQTTDVGIDVIRRDIEAVVRGLLAPTGLVTNETRFHINPTGRFVIGGPAGDSGVTGRKIIVDSYGGAAAHGGGAFSGKDPSKVDRSAAYYARYVAKNIVAAGLAGRCEIQIAYAIGTAEPVSICVDTFGTGKVEDERLTAIVRDGGLFDFRPGMLVRQLGLKHPRGWSYRDTASYGHFGREAFPWERLDRVDALRAFAAQ